MVVGTELNDSWNAANSVRGDPTDPVVLRRAGVDRSSALVAGTGVDIDNLAITLTARSLNERLFMLARRRCLRRCSAGELITLPRLITRPVEHSPVETVPLLLQRQQARPLLPDVCTALQADDRILCCDSARARTPMRLAIAAHRLAPEMSATMAVPVSADPA